MGHSTSVYLTAVGPSSYKSMEPGASELAAAPTIPTAWQLIRIWQVSRGHSC